MTAYLGKLRYQIGMLLLGGWCGLLIGRAIAIPCYLRCLRASSVEGGPGRFGMIAAAETAVGY